MDSTSAANLAAAGSTAAAAAFAWPAARRSWQASETLGRIEQARWHEELTPQLDVTLESAVGAGSDNPRLRVTLLGPLGLGDGLQELTIRIRDDRLREPSGIAGGPTTEQIAAQVWGPFRFTPRVDGADELGRSVAPITLATEESSLFQLERSIAAPWFAWWQTRGWATAPLVRVSPAGARTWQYGRVSSDQEGRSGQPVADRGRLSPVRGRR